MLVKGDTGHSSISEKYHVNFLIICEIAFATIGSVCNNMIETTLEWKRYVANPVVPFSLISRCLQWCVYLDDMVEWIKKYDISTRSRQFGKKHSLLLFVALCYVCVWLKLVCKNCLPKCFDYFDISRKIMQWILVKNFVSDATAQTH